MADYFIFERKVSYVELTLINWIFMFEGLIVSKFANKAFEKDVFKVVKRHATWGALELAEWLTLQSLLFLTFC